GIYFRIYMIKEFFFSSRRRHTRSYGDWSSDVCSSDLTHGRFSKIDDIGKTIIQVENPEYDPVYKWKKREDKDHESAPMEQRLIRSEERRVGKEGRAGRTPET